MKTDQKLSKFIDASIEYKKALYCDENLKVLDDKRTI